MRRASDVAHAATPELSPEDTASKYLAEIQNRGYGELAKFTHPDELARFKSGMLPVLAKNADDGGTMSRAYFDDAATLASITSMPPQEFFNGFLKVAGKALKSFSFKSFMVARRRPRRYDRAP